MALLGNVPTLSYVRWVNLLVTHRGTTYQIFNDHTNKPFIYWDVDSPYELTGSNVKLAERTGRYYIIFNDKGKYIIVPNDDIELNFSEGVARESVSEKILGISGKLTDINNTMSENFTTVQMDMEGIKTTVGEIKENVTTSQTNISILEQRADEINAEVSQIKIDYSYDEEMNNLRNDTNSSLLSLQSLLGLFSSDMNKYMEDNRLTDEENNEINAYKTSVSEERTKTLSQIDVIIDLLKAEGKTSEVTKLNNAKNKINTAINNLLNNLTTVCTDRVFTNSEIVTVIDYFGNASISINEAKNLIDECIYLSFGGSLVEEIGKLTVRQDEIKLSVTQTKNSVSTLEGELGELGNEIESVDQKWAEIMLDPETGIQSQVGDLEKHVNTTTGEIIERLETAEQQITPSAIINTVSGTYYSKTEVNQKLDEVDTKIENIDIGVVVSEVDVMYYLSTSSTSVTGGIWTTNVPTLISGRYIWSKTVTKYNNGTSTETSPVCITDSKNIKTVVEQYYLSTSKTTQTGGSWTTVPPTWSNGKYIWTRSLITYLDGTTYTSTPTCDSTWDTFTNVQEQVNNNKVEIETTKSTLSQHAVKLDSITSRVEETESTVTTINGEIDSLETRVSSAEQKITANAIVSTVTNSTNWTNQTNAIATAQSTANNASSIANTANSTANSANSTANSASSTANTANSTANSALNKANTNATNISKVEQTANKINWIVASGTSVSNMTLTSDFYELVSENINITGYVTFSDLAGSGKTTINGDNITSGTIKGVTIISTINNLRRVTMVNDGLYFYSDNKQAGEIHFDSNGEGTTSSAKDRFLIKSTNSYVLKLLSTGDVSIDANAGTKDIYLIAQDVHTSKDLGVGGELVSQGIGRFYKGISADGEIYTTGNLRCGGTLTIGSTATFSGAISSSGQISTTANMLVGTTLKVTGATTLSSTLNVSGASTLASLSATTGTFSGAITGQSTMTLSGKLNGASAGFSGNVDVTGVIYGAGNIQLDNVSTYFPATGSTATANRLRLGNSFLQASTSGTAIHFATSTGGNGIIYAGQLYANGYNNLSDKRAKTDIKYVNIDSQTTDENGIVSPNTNITTNDMLNFIETLPMVSYRLNEEVDNGENNTHYGFLTQDVLYTKVGSELVILPEDGEESNEFMKYSVDKFMAFICGALQEEIKLRKELENKVKELNNEINGDE